MTTPIIEAMARAIYGPGWDKERPPHQDKYYEMAFAALAALAEQEPSEGMVHEASRAVSSQVTRQGSLNIYRAMLSQAVREATP